eukprot:m.331547 g.331547  ORF g.331547 m.331547 type:complete len:64 (+) comp16752_c0_seq1:1263-1454(+)
MFYPKKGTSLELSVIVKNCQQLSLKTTTTTSYYCCYHHEGSSVGIVDGLLCGGCICHPHKVQL